MTTIKVKFHPSSIMGVEGEIFYHIAHNNTVKLINSGCNLMPDEWDEEHCSIAVKHRKDRDALLQSVKLRIRRDCEKLTSIMRNLNSRGKPFSAKDIVDEFRKHTQRQSLFNFMESLIIRFKRDGKIRTSETYTSTLNSFRHFLDCRSTDDDIMLKDITPELMESFEAWHKGKGTTLNTISFYTRILRAVYNRAVESGMTEDRRPFHHVYTGVDKTVKRALPIKHIRRIKSLDLSRDKTGDYARDMFMMSFYLRGMSFIDMAFLRKSDLKNGYIVYRRRKTGRLLTIEWTKQMQRILDKYPANPTVYLLPIIRSSNINERCAYRNAGYNINHNLKKIASLLGLPISLTLYVARHSWASAAKAKGIPLSVISEGMGHENETTTQIYLAALDTSVIDKANSLIISSI